MSQVNTTSNLGYRQSAYFVKELMERGKPFYVLEKFGMSKPLPSNSTKTMSFRRYFLAYDAFPGSAFSPEDYYTDAGNDIFYYDPTNMTHTNDGPGGSYPDYRLLGEGVTPQAADLDTEDHTVTIYQYGIWTDVTDVISDTHDDPVLQEAAVILGEAAAFLAEKIYYNALKACTNDYFCGGSSLGTVDETISLNTQRLVVRGLKRNLGKPITTVLKSTPAYGTEACAAAYICVTHPDMESDIRALSGFTPAEKYGTGTPLEGEIGKVESVRYILSTCIQSLGEVGALIGTTGLEGTTNVVVYPMLYFAANAYCIVPLKGKNAFTPMILPPGVPRGGDPLGQRGSVGIKFYTACKVLHPYWMAAVFAGATALTA